jgi:hypothetical protein
VPRERDHVERDQPEDERDDPEGEADDREDEEPRKVPPDLAVARERLRVAPEVPLPGLEGPVDPVDRPAEDERAAAALAPGQAACDDGGQDEHGDAEEGDEEAEADREAGDEDDEGDDRDQESEQEIGKLSPRRDPEATEEDGVHGHPR